MTDERPGGQPCALFHGQRAGPSHTAATYDGGVTGDALGDLRCQAGVLGSEVEPRSHGSCQLNPVTRLGPFTRRGVDDALRGAPLGSGDGFGSCSIDRRAWGENTELAAMGTVAAARSPQRPVHPAGLHPAGNEVVTGGEELPALGQFDVAVLRAPQPELGVVHVEVQAVEIAVGHDPSVVDRRDRDAPQPSSLGCRTGLRVRTQPCRSEPVACARTRSLCGGVLRGGMLTRSGNGVK